MAFRTLALQVALALTATCSTLANNYYDFEGQIEEFSSSYAVVSPNYHLAKLPCNGCPNKFSPLYNTEFLVLNFSTAADAVLLNGKQIYPATDPAPEIFVHQVPSYTDLNMFDYDFRSTYHSDLPFYPLSRLGYVVNMTSWAHPSGSSNSTLDFRVIQVGPSVRDCLDSVALTIFRASTGAASVVKGARFVQNEESFLPGTEDFDPYNVGGYYGPSVANTSDARKCHPFDKDSKAQLSVYRYDDYYGWPSRFRQSVTPLQWFVVVLGSFLTGLFIALLGFYFRTGLHRGASRAASAVHRCSVSAWSRLRGGSGGAIRLPTSVKKDVMGSQEQE